MYNKIIGIIGGGPNSVYATDILLKNILRKKYKKKIKIIFFDKNGLFGYGNTHNINLPKQILLNRIAHQTSLGAYPFIKFPKKYSKYDYNFMEWLKKKKINNIKKESWPPRAIFASALKDKFFELIKIISEQSNIDFELIYDEVINIKSHKKKYLVKTSKKENLCTNLLFCTGNYHTSKNNSKLSKSLNSLTKNTKCDFHYDYLNLLPKKDFWKRINNKKMIIYGTGVSSIDIITLLINKNNKIYSISNSSLFPFARPFNQKIDNPKIKEHKPIFLDDSLIDYLKKLIDNKNNFKTISFEKLIHPFIKLEMYYLYFTKFLDHKKSLFIKNKILLKIKLIKNSEKNNFLPLVKIFDNFLIENINNLNKKFLINEWFGQKKIIQDIQKRKYNFYDIFINPLIFTNKDDFRTNYLKFLNWDINEAKKGNMVSAYKNTCDGVWRDIRQQYTKLFDNCENLKVFNYFIKKILPIHNKLCDGPSVESIEKIKNLILKRRILIIRKNQFKFRNKKNNIYMISKNNRIKIDMIFYGILDLYKKDYSKDRLILSMIKNNILELNKKKIDNKIYIIGLNLDKNQNPVIKNKPQKKLTFIGPSSEGKKFFHHTLSRPDKLQPNIIDLIKWSNNVIH